MATDCLAETGFKIVRGVLTADEAASLVAALGFVNGPGRRNLLELPVIQEFANSEKIRTLLAVYFESEPLPVRAIYFNKTAAHNWFVAWHQDLSIAVRRRIDCSGFDGWTTKEGVLHVQPPPEILAAMVTVRFHLDDAARSNGCLRVIPGTHQLGRLSPDAIEQLINNREPTTCEVAAGDALLMRPLLLHSSMRSVSEAPRRVLHFEFAANPLPHGLEWHASH